MSSYPDKLIAVGMRFRPTQDQEYLKSFIPQINDPGSIKPEVEIKHEFNTNGVNGQAYAVLIKGVHVAYIRNQDVPQYDAAASQTLVGCGAKYAITKYTPNYLILQRITSSLENTAKYAYAFTESGTSSKHATLANNTAGNLVVNGEEVATKKYVNEQLNKPKDTQMNIQSSMRDSFFREVKNVAIDVQSGKFGVQSQDGISVYVDGGVSVNPITDFGVKVPAFAMRVAVETLEEGDIIISGQDASFFKQKTESGYEVVTLNGEVKQVGQVTNLFFGKNTVLAVKNMFGENTNPMMMAMMMGDGKDFDMKTFAMMSMMGGKQMDQNMLMMMMLMNK